MKNSILLALIKALKARSPNFAVKSKDVLEIEAD